jgi:AsmA protein
MQETDPTYEQSDTSGTPRRKRSRLRRYVAIYYVVLALLILVFLPPYISVNRYQRRIASSISQSLGRPVHLDHVTLNLLPLPGFTLDNFVVSEDPAFGSEPVIRANSVKATLRVSSLWSRRVEFSSISLTEPSVNLVHLANGKWNLDSILLQAARIKAAPTGQKTSGPAPRFPYIEATGARLNLKLGEEKIPLSLTDADFALWLSGPAEWHVRLEAHPARTDGNVSDAGVVRLEGTLGRAASLLDVPLNLEGEWRNAPLGEASRLVMGRDAGLRGNLTLTAKAQGTLGNNHMETRLTLSAARRADFVPEHALGLEVACLGTSGSAFHSFTGVQCSWPPPGSSDKPILALTADVPDVRQLADSTLTIDTKGIPADTMLDWLRVASERVPQDLVATGTVTGSLAYHPKSKADGGWDGAIELADGSLTGGTIGSTPLTVGAASLEAAATQEAVVTRGRKKFAALPVASGFVLAPTQVELGGKEPAEVQGTFDSKGYTLRVTGAVVLSKLLALGAALPQFGDGMEQALPKSRVTGPVKVDLTATRAWGGAQSWQEAPVHAEPARVKRVSTRR